MRDLYQRAAEFCDDLAAARDDDGDGQAGDVLVIAHGGTVRVLDAYLNGVPVDQMAWRPVDNATDRPNPRIRQRISRGGNR